MKFPKTLIVLTVLNLTVAAGFAPAAVIEPTPAASAAPAVVQPRPAAVTAAVPQATTPTTEDIRDIRGPISIPYGWLWAAYLAGGVALAALAYGGWRWYRRHAAERAKLPHEIALERLEKARALMTPEQAREYSFAVSEITRRYIEARFQERAPRRTTEEFLHDLLARSDAPLSTHREQLADFLRHCDLAKFARWQFSVPDMENMHESARTFIQETQPQPTKAAPATAGRNGTTPDFANPQPAR